MILLFYKIASIRARMKIDTAKLLSFTQSLVRVESLSGQEKAAADLAAEQMRALGFDEVHVDENGSLVGFIAGDQPGPTLLLDGHCDTVGVAPGAAWRYEPYGATVADGRLYGRGTSDMKGALAAMITAAAAADRSRLHGRVAVSATVLEEVMEGGALAAVVDFVQPDFVVIGEATGLNLARGGRGRAEIHLETRGKPAHSSTPHLGVNAVHRMLPAVQAIEQMPLPSDPLLGEAIVVLTDIISDPYPGRSVIPSRCRVTYDRRVLPGETEESVLEGLNALSELNDVEAIIAQGEHETYTGATLRGPKFFPAWKLPAEHELVQGALAGLRQTGLDPALGAYRFCTNAAHSAGRAQIPTVGFGPSAEGQAHVVDEYVELEQLFAAARGYRGIIEAVLS
ncbi:MAG: YgeY family selenium metabolism-linked hydrolase [Candidatus Promineifilaceae bacterium]|nr:YgeY family selenium metabolism-linked hydrolase [Candidatus Promineifilaceae bacterium]